MSEAETARTDRFDNGLTDQERAAFVRLYERHDGDDIEAIAEAVLQSSGSESEEAN